MLIMSSLLLSAATLFLPLTSALLDYETQSQNTVLHPHLKLQAAHFLDFPVMKKDFQSWSTVGSAVIMRNRSVIVPEARDKKGIIYNTKPNELVKDWMLDVEIEMGNAKKSSRGGTGVALLYVRDIGSGEVSHTESQFGFTNRYEGIGIYLNTVLKSERGANNEITNAIQGFYNAGERVVNVFHERAHTCYKKIRNLPAEQSLKLRVQYDSPLVTVSVYDFSGETFEFCFSFEAPLDFNGYFLLSGASGVNNPDHIYLNSFRLYDPKTVTQNDHFLQARRAKLEGGKDELSQRLQQGVKDLFERHSQAEMNISGSGSGSQREKQYLIETLPVEHHQLNLRLDQVFQAMEEQDTRFFDALRGIPSKQKFETLNSQFYSFRIAIDGVNTEIEKDMKRMQDYERKLKQVRYQSNISKGVTQREVQNPSLKQLHSELNSLDLKLQQLELLLKDYQQTVEILGAKVRRDGEGFSQRLEEGRKRFAKEQSESMDYDMSDIDRIFDQMETQVVQSAGGWSQWIVNIGMIMVIGVSVSLWVKMQRYESKNA